MVLVRDRRAKQREDAIAGGLHDIAVVAMRRVHHEFKRWIDDRARFFRVNILHQVHQVPEAEKCSNSAKRERFEPSVPVTQYARLAIRTGSFTR